MGSQKLGHTKGADPFVSEDLAHLFVGEKVLLLLGTKYVRSSRYATHSLRNNSAFPYKLAILHQLLKYMQKCCLGCNYTVAQGEKVAESMFCWLPLIAS